jgi:hypothetical protein
MSNKQPNFIVYDGRYRFDQESALVMCTANSLQEAKRFIADSGDAVAVDNITGEIVYDPME